MVASHLQVVPLPPMKQRVKQRDTENESTLRHSPPEISVAFGPDCLGQGTGWGALCRVRTVSTENVPRENQT